MKRYDAMHDNDYVSTDRRESPTGQYVLASDVAALERKADALAQALVTACGYVRHPDYDWFADDIKDAAQALAAYRGEA